MSAVGLGLATPKEKLFIFDIQNAMAGLFFFHHHLRGEKGREEGKGDRDRCAPIPGTYSAERRPPPSIDHALFVFGRTSLHSQAI